MGLVKNICNTTEEFEDSHDIKLFYPERAISWSKGEHLRNIADLSRGCSPRDVISLAVDVLECPQSCGDWKKSSSGRERTSKGYKFQRDKEGKPALPLPGMRQLPIKLVISSSS